ncbi:hypothetical protein BJV74DRAFT_831418 [Russula compacta]|nr:hypothetical protein BJV74DRAFT_831418 [Russula compacta]
MLRTRASIITTLMICAAASKLSSRAEQYLRFASRHGCEITYTQKKEAKTTQFIIVNVPSSGRKEATKSHGLRLSRPRAWVVVPPWRLRWLGFFGLGLGQLRASSRAEHITTVILKRGGSN